MKGIRVILISAIALFVLSTSCVQAGQSLKRGCVVIAREHQEEVKAQARLQHYNVWTRILCVHFQDQEIGHAYCVFSLQTGVICRYDEYNGTHSLITRLRDPKHLGQIVCSQVERPFAYAYFMDSN